jgi:hypothetical protein
MFIPNKLNCLSSKALINSQDPLINYFNESVGFNTSRKTNVSFKYFNVVQQNNQISFIDPRDVIN